MPFKKLCEYLDNNKVKYVVISHSPAFTAQEIAAKAHIPGIELAKTVIMRLDGKFAMAVLPASFHVDVEQLRHAAGAEHAEVAAERDFENQFIDCDVGAMPPFGNLYGMPVYVAEKLAEDENIAFNACSHTELIKMKYKDFERLVKPKVLKFSVQLAAF